MLRASAQKLRHASGLPYFALAAQADLRVLLAGAFLVASVLDETFFDALFAGATFSFSLPDLAWDLEAVFTGRLLAGVRLFVSKLFCKRDMKSTTFVAASSGCTGLFKLCGGTDIFYSLLNDRR